MSFDAVEHLRKEFEQALAKLKAGMDSGPFGDNVILTPSESTLLYRMITEAMPALRK